MPHNRFDEMLLLACTVQTVSEVLLPEDPMPILEHPECSIRPGCLYNIFVESTDRAINESVQLLVPGNVNCSLEFRFDTNRSALHDVFIAMRRP